MKADFETKFAARVCAALVIAVTLALAIAPVEAAAPAGERIEKAADYPHKPIRIIDPFVPGGASDVIARLVGQKLTDRFGQAVIVESRPGAGGNVGAEIAAKATPDGYTLFMAIVLSLAPSVSLYQKLGFDPMKDLTYVTLAAGGSYVIVTSPSFPAKTVPELVTLAKSKPGQISYGSSGVGGPVHLAGELFNSRAGMKTLHVPYKGAGPILAAVLANEVQLGYSSVAGALPLIKAGRVYPLAVTSAQRAKTLPDVPTIAESGYPGYDITPWYGFAAPGATPTVIVKALSVEIGRILQSPDVQASLANLGLDATSSTHERFREIMRGTIETSAKIIKDVGIKLE
jgi:tripartite-type tricarboxylate transporter receptor subunit TctC